MATINIYPCVDALLYAPVYLAIESFRYQAAGHLPGTARPRPEGDPKWMEWSFGEGLPVVRLHAPLIDGDLANFERLKDKTLESPDEIHIAIGDPAEALLLLPASEHENRFHILATFVNRIALWCVCRRKGFKNGDREARQLKANEAKDLVKELEDGYFADVAAKRRFTALTLGYSAKGATTRALMRAFVDPLFRKKPILVDALGAEELKRLIDGSIDVTFTFEPWLLSKIEGYVEGHYKVLRWFHSVPYPFSALVIYGDVGSFTGSKKDAVVDFLKRCQVGLGLLYRYRDTAVHLLTAMGDELRDFGLRSPISAGDSEKLSYSERDEIVRDAFGQLLLSECFCESMKNAWMSWDFALQVNAGVDFRKRMPKSEIVKSFVQIGKNREILDLLNDWTFRDGNEFRKLLGQMVQKRGITVDVLPPMI